jgi:hypothetical protein
MKRAAADRAAFRSVEAGAGALLSKRYAAERRRGISPTSAATPSATQAGGFRGGEGGSAADAGDPADYLRPCRALTRSAAAT